jgi:hypothetical protein
MGVNKNKQHQEAVRHACYWLARFGYLRSQDLGQLIYPAHKSRTRMASRLTKALADKGLVVSHQDNAYSPTHYALSAAGAKLAKALTGVSYQHGTDLLRFISGHRDAANSIAIKALNEGYQVITDREIQTSQGRTFGNKVPDCLILDDYTDDGGHPRRDYHWVEVENCKRGGRDLQRLASWILHWAFPNTRGYCTPFRDGYLAKVLLVVADPVAHRIRERVIAEMRKQANHHQKLAWLDQHAPDLVEQVNLAQQTGIALQ